MKIRSPHRSYRSPMAAVCEIAFHGSVLKREPFSLREYLRQRNAQEKVKETVRKHRITPPPNVKYTRVTRKSESLWHASGVGEFWAKDFDTVRDFVREKGYTHIRMNDVDTTTAIAAVN